jgi:DNA gyrase subunit B
MRSIDWSLASSAESRQMLAKYAILKDQLVGPYVIEYAAKGKTEEPEEAAEETPLAEGAEAPSTIIETRSVKKAAKGPQDPVEKATAGELFAYVIEQGKKAYDVQRYKGLGEMTAEQLWQTTMDPERRRMLQVKLEDIAACEEIFTTLMGEDVESRRKFIEENALDVKNLDI